VIVDAHQHVWNLEDAEYPWLDSGLAPIDRTMELDEVLPAMRRLGVTASVLVQSADNAEDTATMLRVADEHPEVVGIVAWVPLDEPARAARMLAELTRDDRVVGVRALLHTMPDPGWILRDDVDEGLGLLAEAGLSFDFVAAGPASLALVPVVSARHPTLGIVIDHLGAPPVGGSPADRRAWRQLLAAAAENPRVTAKVSGLYSGSGDLAAWTPDELRPVFDDALEVFGPDRLLAGGDWPIVELAGGYERVWTALLGLAGGLDEAARAAVLGGTAERVYGLDAGRLESAAAGGRG
jgi:L-fuconolactonase